MANEVRVRWGIKGLISIFPNAGIIVRYLSLGDYERLQGITSALKAGLQLIGWADIADKIICEAS